MATIKSFVGLDVWQKARLMCKDVYEITMRGTFARDWALREQINRSSGSVMDNIAEGFERDGKKEFIQYLPFAKASAVEVHSQLFRALDRGHIDQSKFDSLVDQLLEINRMIGGLMKYLRSTELRGIKFKPETRTRN